MERKEVMRKDFRGKFERKKVGIELCKEERSTRRRKRRVRESGILGVLERENVIRRDFRGIFEGGERISKELLEKKAVTRRKRFEGGEGRRE